MSDYDARPLWRERVLAVRLSPGHRLVARVLAELVSADGIGRVSNGELVRRTGLHRTTVIRALKRLDELDLLEQLVRGGYTPTGVRVSKWQLRDPGGVEWPVDNGVKVASSDVEHPGSRSHSATLSPGSRSQEATLTGVKVASRYPSRSQIATLPLGGEDKDKEASSLGVSLTSDGGAALAVVAPSGVVNPDEANAVLRAIPDLLRARDTEEHERQRYLVMERLANGCSVTQIVEDGERAARSAQSQVIARGQALENPVAWWAKNVRRRPAPPPLSQLPWCGECDRNGEHDAKARWRELEDGSIARCPACHPEEVLRRQQEAAALARVMAS